VTPIVEKMRESYLRWFGDVQRIVIDAPMRKSGWILVERMKKVRGIPKITLVEIVKKDMLIKKVIESMTLYRIEWQKRIDAANLD